MQDLCTIFMSQVAKVTHLSTPPGPAPAPPPTEPAKVGVALKVYAKCLAPDIEYKTVIVTRQMSSRELILVLLSKCRMKHRDPKLFYLTMDVTVKKTGKFIFTEKHLSPCITRLISRYSDQEDDGAGGRGEAGPAAVLQPLGRVQVQPPDEEGRPGAGL